MAVMYWLTLREMKRKKVILVTFILVAIYLSCYALGLYYVVPSGERAAKLNPVLVAAVHAQLLGFAIYMGGFISAFLAIFSTAGTIASEAETGLLQPIATKPLRRWEIVIGKALGYATGCVLFNCLLLAAILTVAHLTTGQEILFDSLGRVLFLFCLQPLPLLAVTLLASVYLPAVAAGVAGSIAFIVSITGGMMGQMGQLAFQNDALIKIGIVSSYLAPMDSLYRLIYTALVPPTFLGELGPFGASLRPAAWMPLYSVGYIIVFLLLSILAFQKKDL